MVMRRESAHLPDATYVELVQELFETLPPSLIMSGLFLAIGILGNERAHDLPLMILLVAGVLASFLRLGFVVLWRTNARLIREREEAAALERGFALTYIPFAMILGLFCARLLWLRPDDLHTLATVLVVGYCAGVGAGVYVRPAIAIASILVSVAPIAAVVAVSPLTTDRLLAITLAAFTAGGIGSVLSRYRSEAAKISQRLKLASMSRYDSLTSLPNRLALLEEYEVAIAEAGGDQSLWLHCLSLDGVAAINIAHGHAVGDRLIKQAASRLSSIVGDHGLPARLGGVEFVVLQSQIRHSNEAEQFAKRIVRALGEPYPLGDQEVRLSASIGFARAGDRAAALDDLLDAAEAAMHQVKRDGGNAARAA